MHRKLLLFFFGIFCWTTMDAQRTVTGAVTDPQGEPVVGATVTMKGAAGGAVTDTAGCFSLQLPEGVNTLVVRYTGYAVQEVAVSVGVPITIKLTQEGIRLPETVVTALNIPREARSLGYATQQLEGKAVSEVRETNLVNSLSGKLAGVQVITSSGNLGGSSRIVIRGIRSITGENQPLFVVDGVPMDNSNFNTQQQIDGLRGVDYGNTIQDLNPNDIETIDVLKGAAAAALYGSRAANGVIVITTKKGGFNAPLEVSVSSQTTFESVAVLPEFQNEYGGGDDDGPFFVLNGEPVVNSFSDRSWGPKFDPNLLVRQWYSFFPGIPEYYGKTTPWVAHPNNIRDFFKTGVSLNNSISISGGGRAMNTRLSYANTRQTSPYPNSLLDRHQIGLNAGLRLSKWLDITANINYATHRAHGRAGSGSFSSGTGQPVTQSLLAWHQRQIDMDILEKYYKVSDIQQVTWNSWSYDNPVPVHWDNPYWQAYESAPEDGRGRAFGNLAAVFQCAPGLTFTTRLSLDNYTDRREEKSTKNSSFVSDGSYSTAIYVVSERNADFLLNYRKNFRHDFSLYTVLGSNFRKNRDDIFSAQTSGGLIYAGIYNLANSNRTPYVSANRSERVVNGVFGTANLGYKSTVYLELSGRNDWASTLPPGQNSTFYPSASLSFVFSELGRLAASPWLSFGKLRLNWAQVGLDVPPYALKNTYVGKDPIYDYPAASASYTQKTPDLKVQQTVSWELGLELRLFRDRIGLDASAYRTNSNNQILLLPLSGATGLNDKYINAGLIRNQGLEIALTAAPVVKRNFRWDISLNWTRNSNKILDLYHDDRGNNLTTYYLGGTPTISYFYAREGEPYGTLFGHDFYRDANNNPVVNPKTGYYLINPALQPLGSIQPDWISGIQNMLSYKNFSLGFLVDVRKGGKMAAGTVGLGRYTGVLAETAANNIRETGAALPGVLQATDDNGNLLFNPDGTPMVTSQPNDIFISAKDYWSKNLSGNFVQSTRIYDASYIKLREARLSYRLPEHWLGKKRVKALHISVVGRNLWLIHKNVPHIDPDNASNSGNIQGLEGGQVPSTRTIGINLSVRF
ncbi:MAG: SusC/RagA family TonB-linked outer membrane protein [Thermoanaerobaculia bacterium]|nr:SusC/RagA family TonB-linked outer membrane protein [Thermoanaerobaculia bacterium]